MQTARTRRHATRTQHVLRQPSVLLKRDRQSLRASLLRSNQLLRACLANQLLLRRRRASNFQQRDRIGLSDGREPRVSSSHVALPVRVLGNVGGGNGDGVVVCAGVDAAWWWVAELRVQGDTRGALGVDREEPVDEAINTPRLDRVFLHMYD